MNFRHYNRRHFLTLASKGVGLAIVSAGLVGCLKDVHLPKKSIPVMFKHGVASGDPAQDAIILWTRVTPVETNFNGEIPVIWEVATDAGFTNLVTNGKAAINASTDFTLKIDAINLSPDTTYYYRFISGETISPTGSARTLPVDDIAAVKLAVMSCSNFPAGHFNVYDLAAKQKDLNAVLHLGDYIYEYGPDGYASENAVKLGRVVQPAAELMSLQDYRTRYAQYRSDTRLQNLHAALPFIVVWDDHEIANDTWKGGAENHPVGVDFEERKLAALQAYFEWMPIRPVIKDNNEIINRKFTFANLVDLYMLDTRVIARDQQLDYANYIDPTAGTIDGTGFTADLYDTNRSLLGAEQLQWLQGSIATSTATWQVLGQQVLMGRMLLPASVATRQLSISEYAKLAQLAVLAQRAQAEDPTLTADELAYLAANQRALTQDVLALLQLPAIPYNLDAWDGYPYEREVVLSTAKKYKQNLVVLAGDTHNAWANNLKDASGELVGVEFATPSVSSPGFETYLSIAVEDAETVEAQVVQFVEDLQYFNATDRGFMTVTFTSEKVTTQWHYVDTVLSTEYVEKDDRKQVVQSLAGEPRVELISDN